LQTLPLRHPASVGISAHQLSYNGYASFGVVHERKETTHDERLVVHLQHMEEQFVAKSRRLMEQIRASSNQLDAMDVANGRRRQPNPCFVDEDDVVTFREARS
jgi:hypothetical protein